MCVDRAGDLHLTIRVPFYKLATRTSPILSCVLIDAGFAIEVSSRMHRQVFDTRDQFATLSNHPVP